MGCIEIVATEPYHSSQYRLTLTWDVLKWQKQCVQQVEQPQINFNMGCIEIFEQYEIRLCKVQINFNMGCIEIIHIRKRRNLRSD